MTNKKIISTGFQSLDETLGGGFHNGSLNVIAARPGMGKTIFAMQCAYGMAKNTEGQIYIQSLEHSSDQVKKLITDIGEDKRIIIDDTPAVTPTQMRKNLAGVPDLAAIVIDYVQLMKLNYNADKQSSTRSYNEIAEELVSIAKELNVPIICTFQLTRALEKRRDCHPVLSDFNASFEPYADVILSIYRYSYYYGTMGASSSAEIGVLKNNYGECKALPFHWDRITYKFSKPQLYDINQVAAEFYHRHLFSKEGETALTYLKSRDIELDTIKEYVIGVAPDEPDRLLCFLKEKGYSVVEMIEAGLVVQNNYEQLFDRFHSRIMFPITDLSGNIITFIRKKYSNNSADSVYLISPSPKNHIHKEDEYLIGLNVAKGFVKKQIVVVEGIWDLMALYQTGVPNAVATMDWNFTEKQASLLADLAEEVIICFDSDQSGKKPPNKRFKY